MQLSEMPYERRDTPGKAGLLALDEPARRWESKRLRVRLFSAAGCLVRGSGRLRMRLPGGTWASQITTAISSGDFRTPNADFSPLGAPSSAIPRFRLASAIMGQPEPDNRAT